MEHFESLSEGKFVSLKDFYEIGEPVLDARPIPDGHRVYLIAKGYIRQSLGGLTLTDKGRMRVASDHRRQASLTCGRRERRLPRVPGLQFDQWTLDDVSGAARSKMFLELIGSRKQLSMSRMRSSIRCSSAASRRQTHDILSSASR
jgi:hypothetical protein